MKYKILIWVLMIFLLINISIADDLDCWFDPVYQEPEGVRDVWCNYTNTTGGAILNANISHSTYDTNDWYKNGLMNEMGWFLGYQPIPNAYNSSQIDFTIFSSRTIDSIKRAHLEFGPFTYPFSHVKQEVSVLLQAGSGASTLRVMVCNDTYTTSIMSNTPIYLSRTSLYPGCQFAGVINASEQNINYNNWTWGTVDITDAYNNITKDYTGLKSYSVHFSSYDETSVSPVGWSIADEWMPPQHNNTLESFSLHNDIDSFVGIDSVGYPEYESYENSINMSGNVLLFHLNETSGSVLDYSGNNNNGVYSGTGYDEDGRFGKGYLFDGVDDAIIIQDDNTLDFTYISTGMWIKPNSIDGWISLIHKKTDTTNGLYFEIYNGALYNYNTISTPNSVIDTDVWSFVTYTAGPTYERIYLNGELLVEELTQFTGTDNNYDLAIGKSFDYANEEYNGYMDEPFLFNREITSDEVYSMYLHGKNKFIPDERVHNITTYKEEKNFLLASDSLEFDSTTQFPYFDSNDDVLIPQNISSWQSIGNTNSSFTLCYFLKRNDTSTTYRRIEKWENPGETAAMSFYIDKQDITFWIRENAGAGCGYKRVNTVGDLVGDTEWHHVCAIVDRENEEMKVILDGEKVGSLSVGSACEINEITEVVIGRDTISSSSDNGFIGQLSQPMLHNDAHTAGEILEGINSAWWSMGIGTEITNDVYATGYLYNSTTYLWEDTPGHTPLVFTKIYNINNESANMVYNNSEELYHYDYYTNKPELVTSQGISGVNMTNIFEVSTLNDTAYWYVAGSSNATCSVNLEWQYPLKTGQDALSHIIWEINSTIGLSKRNLYLCEAGYTALSECYIYTGDSMSLHKRWDNYGEATVVCEVQNDYMTEPFYANDTLDIGCWSAYDEYDGTKEGYTLVSDLHVCSGTHTMVGKDGGSVILNNGNQAMVLEGPTTFDGENARGNHSTYNDYKIMFWGFNLKNKQINANGMLTIQNGDTGFFFEGMLNNSYFANINFINMSIAFDLEHYDADNFSIISNTFTNCGIGGEDAIFINGHNVLIQQNTFNKLADDGDTNIYCEGCSNVILEQNYYWDIEDLEIYSRGNNRTINTSIGSFTGEVGEYGSQYPYANYETLLSGEVSKEFLNGASLYGPIKDYFPYTSLLFVDIQTDDTEDGIMGVKTAAFVAFGLIALALLASIAFLIIKMFGDGVDMASLSVVAIMAIGVSIFLVIAYVIISTVANGLI